LVRGPELVFSLLSRPAAGWYDYGYGFSVFTGRGRAGAITVRETSEGCAVRAIQFREPRLDA
jgi:hypothetical protein